MKKILLIVGAVILSIVLIAGITFKIKYNKMVKLTETAYNELQPVDLTNFSDGIYEGGYENFIIKADVDVTIKNHTIINIEIVKQKSGSKYRALDTIDRILRKQIPKVDATTGATGSSMALILATADALSKE